MLNTTSGERGPAMRAEVIKSENLPTRFEERDGSAMNGYLERCSFLQIIPMSNSYKVAQCPSFLFFFQGMSGSFIGLGGGGLAICSSELVSEPPG
jgi:hypothetical protein